MLMETSCTNPLNVRNYLITFKPDFRKNQTRYQEPETISPLNVPSEADEDSMTQFVQQYAVVIGRPRYPTENIKDIEYLTGCIQDGNIFLESSKFSVDKYNVSIQNSPNNKNG